MSQSLTKLLVHLVYSTKERRPLITDVVREEIHRYSAGILKDMESPAILINSVQDHMHILFLQSKNWAMKDIVEEVKKGTSRWIKKKGPEFRDFWWQAGYGAFSVSQSNVEQVTRYIRNQREHHKKTTFQDEFLTMCRRYDVAIDEKTAWD